MSEVAYDKWKIYKRFTGFINYHLIADLNVSTERLITLDCYRTRKNVSYMCWVLQGR